MCGKRLGGVWGIVTVGVVCRFRVCAWGGVEIGCKLVGRTRLVLICVGGDGQRWRKGVWLRGERLGLGLGAVGCGSGVVVCMRLGVVWD